MPAVTVLYLHQHFTTPKGAGGTRSYEMARRLVQHGHEVTMVCGSYRGGHTGLDGPYIGGRRCGRVDGIDVIELELPYGNTDGFVRRSITFLRFALQTVGIALREPCDLIFATTTPLTVAIPSVVAKWVRRKPFVFEVRDLWPELPRAMGVIRNPLILGGMRALEWIGYKTADRHIALAPGIKRGIAADGIASESIALIPNGCDVQVFARPTGPWRPAGLRSTDLLAVYAGTHGPANGLNALVDVAVELERRGRRDIFIVLVGEGATKERLKHRVARLRLAQLLFLDAVSKLDIVNVLHGADVGIQCLANVPAFYEGTSPNKFFDYLAAGLPVITNYPGWVASLIDEHNCGLVVPPGNAAAFADALEQLADNRAALASKARQARHLAETQFNRDTLGHEFVRWLEGAARL
jgi:glycosyltransferase involved in cell wall biosynthesis